MARSDHQGWDETRALQTSPAVIDDNYATLLSWGYHNIVKVVGRRPGGSSASGNGPVSGYLTLLPAISGHTPLEMRDILGLRAKDLQDGALVYRLDEMPAKHQIEVRGYTTLVDGVALKAGLRADSGGYRPGHGAYQIALKKGVELRAFLLANLGPNMPFRPAVHPSVAKLYPAGHPARRGL